MRFRPDIQKKLRRYIQRKKGESFSFGDMKKTLFGYTWYGGRAFKLRIKQVFNLKEFKEGRKVMLQKK